MLKRSVWSGYLLGVLLCGSTPTAQAQPTVRPGSTDLEKAKRLFQEGNTLFEKEKYEEALALFRESYILSGQPLLLANMGQCYRNLKRYPESIEAFQSFLREAPDSPKRQEVEALLKEVEALAPATKSPQPLLSTKSSTSAAEQELASQRLTEGRSFFARGQYEQALSLFRDAYFLSSDPLVLIELGRSFRALGLLSEAAEAFRSFLRDAPDSPRRAEVEGYLQEIIALLPAAPSSAPAALTPQERPPAPSRSRTFLFGGAGLAGVGALAEVGFFAFALRSEAQQNDLTIISAQEINDKRTAIEQSKKNALLCGRLATGLLIGATVSTGVGVLMRLREKKEKASQTQAIQREVTP